MKTQLTWSRTLICAATQVILATSCESKLCGVDFDSHFSPTCHSLSSSLVQRQVAGFAACNGPVLNTRSIQISCPAGSGSNNVCSSTSNGDGYFVVLVPDNNGGSFIDTNYSVNMGNGAIPDCNTLFNAMVQPLGQRPSDILAVFQNNSAIGDVLNCTDAGGCTALASNCMNAWDPVNEQVLGTAAALPNGNYLVCAFLDTPLADGTPAQGLPPTGGVGLIGTSNSAAFFSLTLTNPVTAPIDLSTWTDY